MEQKTELLLETVSGEHIDRELKAYRCYSVDFFRAKTIVQGKPCLVQRISASSGRFDEQKPTGDVFGHGHPKDVLENERRLDEREAEKKALDI